MSQEGVNQLPRLVEKQKIHFERMHFVLKTKTDTIQLKIAILNFLIKKITP